MIPAPHGLNLSLALEKLRVIGFSQGNARPVKIKSYLRFGIVRSMKVSQRGTVLAVSISVLKDEFRKVCLPLNCDGGNNSRVIEATILVWIAYSLFFLVNSLSDTHG